MQHTYTKTLSTILLFAGILSVYSLSLHSQDVDEKLANDMYTMGTEVYNYSSKRDAVDLFQRAVEANPAHVKANFMTGKAILETVDKDRALPFFMKAYELDSKVDEDILLYIGKAYHYAMKFDEAGECYQKHADFIKTAKVYDKKERIAEAERRVQEVANAKIYLTHPSQVEIQNLGSGINTSYPEYGPVISADERVLIYTARREDNVNDDKAPDNLYYEDIYIAEYKNGDWQKAQNIGSPINTNYHDSCIGLSPDGKELYIYKDTGEGDIYVCTRNDKGEWSRPKPVEGFINSSFPEGSVSLTPDGKTMYFSSSRPGGKGGFDLYVSHKDSRGKWGRPENLGSQINTIWDEDGVFIASDYKTIYFSSKGHTGMGGFDIYQAVYDSTKKEWSKPMNLGYPINSVDDDIYFVLSGDGKRGYYSSIKDFGKGEKDIYQVSLSRYNPPDFDYLKEQFLKVDKLAKGVMLEVPILDFLNGEPVKANLTAFGDAFQGSKNFPSLNGNFQYQFQGNKSHQARFVVTAKGYMDYTIELTIPSPETAGDVFRYPFRMQRLLPGTKGQVQVFFETESDKPIDKEDMDRLLRLMQDNPEIKVRIEGHTDNQGSSTFNKQLSEKRAQAVKNYLISQGIANERLQARGYGFDRPIASNDTEDGREKNRRTEFVILE